MPIASSSLSDMKFHIAWTAVGPTSGSNSDTGIVNGCHGTFSFDALKEMR